MKTSIQLAPYNFKLVTEMALWALFNRAVWDAANVTDSGSTKIDGREFDSSFYWELFEVAVGDHLSTREMIAVVTTIRADLDLYSSILTCVHGMDGKGRVELLFPLLGSILIGKDIRLRDRIPK